MADSATPLYGLVQPEVGASSNTWGGKYNTALQAIEDEISKPRLKWNAPAVGATTTCDLANGRAFAFTVNQVTTLALTNVPTATFVVRVLLKITNGAAFAFTWPASVVHPSNAAIPTLTAAGVDLIELVTYDAGVTWYSHLVHLKTVSGALVNPRVSVYHSAGQAGGSNATITLAFNNERYDVGTMHDNVTNNSRLVVPAGEGGLYNITGNVRIATGVGGDIFEMIVRKNGATSVRKIQFTGAGGAFSIYEVLAAADYVELQVREVSNLGGFTVDATSDYIGFEAVRVR